MMRVLTGALFATTLLVLAGCSTTAQNPNYQQTTKYKGSNPYGYPATVQQANYQTNSQTQAAAPVTYVQQAGYDQNYNECISKESNRKIIGTAAGGVVGGLVGRKVGGDNKTLGTVAGAAIGGAAGYGIADKTINCDPVTVHATTRPTQPTYQAVTYEAPTAQQGLVENTASLGENGTPGYYAVNGIEPPAPEIQTAEPNFAQIQTIQPKQIQPEPMPFPTTFTAIPQPTGTTRHTVIPGDTLYSLARTTCSSVTEIQNLNTINADFYIRAGEDILLPSGRCAE